MKYKVGDWVEVNRPSINLPNPNVIVRGVIKSTVDYRSRSAGISYFVECIAANGSILNLHVIEKYITALPEKDALLCKLGH